MWKPKELFKPVNGLQICPVSLVSPMNNPKPWNAIGSTSAHANTINMYEK
jgi:hypothetical protein